MQLGRYRLSRLGLRLGDKRKWSDVDAGSERGGQNNTGAGVEFG